MMLWLKRWLRHGRRGVGVPETVPSLQGASGMPPQSIHPRTVENERCGCWLRIPPYQPSRSAAVVRLGLHHPVKQAAGDGQASNGAAKRPRAVGARKG